MILIGEHFSIYSAVHSVIERSQSRMDWTMVSILTRRCEMSKVLFVDESFNIKLQLIT